MIIFWVAALGSFGWVLIGGVFTRWLPRIKTLIGGGNAARLRVVSAAIMLAAFARLLANDSILPVLRDGRWPPLIASIAGGGAALAWLLHADRANKPALKEYVVIVALVAGMTAGDEVARWNALNSMVTSLSADHAS